MLSINLKEDLKMIGAIITAISTAATAIATAVTAVTKALAVVGLAIQGLKAIGQVLVKLGKVLGLIKPQTEVDELGDKAIQSGYKPDDYDSYSDYVNAVEEYDQCDPEKSQKISDEDKINKGIELVTGVTAEKYEKFPVGDLFKSIIEDKSGFFTEGKIDEIGKLILSTDGQVISDIVDFENGSEKNNTKIQNTVDSLVSIVKSEDPEISDKEAYKNVMNLRK